MDDKYSTYEIRVRAVEAVRQGMAVADVARLTRLIDPPFIDGQHATKPRKVIGDYSANLSVGGHAFWTKSVIANCSPLC